MSKSRNWCFTINNYTDEDTEILRVLDCKYLVFGKEVGEEGTKHYQGYVEFVNARSMSGLKKVLPRGHFEVRRGTAEKASLYCKKDKDFTERGKISEQGKRNDLEEVVEDIKLPLQEIAERHPTAFIKFNRGILALREALREDRQTKPYVEWRWGKTGVGKTRYVVEKHKMSHYIKDGTAWWDKYEQEEAILIDDFCGSWPFRDFLRLLDYNKYSGQYKGGYVKINSPFIYITCEYPPSKYWKGNELAQVERRLDKIVEVVGTEVSGTEVGGNTDAHREKGEDPCMWCRSAGGECKGCGFVVV